MKSLWEVVNCDSGLLLLNVVLIMYLLLCLMLSVPGNYMLEKDSGLIHLVSFLVFRIHDPIIPKSSMGAGGPTKRL